MTRPIAHYTCNLVPPALIRNAGFTPRRLVPRGVTALRVSTGAALTAHPMTCPYVTRVLAAAETTLGESPADVFVAPSCCDAMRRAGDLLAASFPGRVARPPIPRLRDPGSVRAFARSLEQLNVWLRARAMLEEAAGETPSQAEPESDGCFTYPTPSRPGGIFVLSGPLSDNALVVFLEQLGATVSGVDSCTSPDRAEQLAALEGISDLEELAGRLLESVVCPRRLSSDRAAYLAGRWDECRPSAVVYARQSFCDPGAYDCLTVAELATERGLPFLEVEIGMPFEANGALRVRLEAFLEAQEFDADLLDGDLFDLDTADP